MKIVSIPVNSSQFNKIISYYGFNWNNNTACDKPFALMFLMIIVTLNNALLVSLSTAE